MSIVLSYQRQTKPPRFLDRYPAELEHRMSPLVFHSRMRAVNTAVQQPQWISRNTQMRVLLALGIIAVCLMMLMATVLEGRILRDACVTPWIVAVAAVIAMVILLATFFSIQNRQHTRRIVADVRLLLEAFNLTDREVGMEWRLTRANTSCGAGWLSSVFPWQIAITASDDTTVDVVEMTRYSKEIDANDLPPPSYSGPTWGQRNPFPTTADLQVSGQHQASRCA